MNRHVQTRCAVWHLGLPPDITRHLVTFIDDELLLIDAVLIHWQTNLDLCYRAGVLTGRTYRMLMHEWRRMNRETRSFNDILIVWPYYKNKPWMRSGSRYIFFDW